MYGVAANTAGLASAAKHASKGVSYVNGTNGSVANGAA